MLNSIKNTKKGLQNGKYFLFRCLSVLPNIKGEVSNGHNKIKKKFAVLKKERNLRPLNSNLINDLFLGKIDKELLKYPDIVQNDESILQHVKEIQNYMNLLSKESFEINEGVLSNLQKLELLGLTAPQSHGGSEYSESETNFIFEHLAVCPKICNLVSYNENFGIKILNLYGTDELKQKYLPKLCSGECYISLAYLENGPFADFASLKCNLVKDNEKNCSFINGEKKWVANANISDLIIVLSKSEILDGDKPKVKFNLNLIEKNTPGITVREIQSNKDGLLGLYTVKFDNVVAPSSSFISNDTQCGVSIVKNALSFNNLSVSVQCLSVLKKILRTIYSYHTNMVPDKKELNELDYLQINNKWLSIYIYVLESVVYLVSGWFDEFDRPDLFGESILTKLLATNMLQSGINKYLQILGHECYKIPSCLEEALQVLHHVSVFDENNLHLKSSVGCYGILHATKSSSQIQETVKMRRNPSYHPWEALFYELNTFENKTKKLRSLQNVQEIFHPSLKKELDMLKWCSSILNITIEKYLINSGNKAIRNDKSNAELADIATYTFTLAACLSRTSLSLHKKSPSSSEELKIVQTFAFVAKSVIQDLYENIIDQCTRPHLFEKIGNTAFKSKKYPMEHPLARSF